MADDKVRTDLDAATAEHITTLLAMLMLAGALASAILAFLQGLVPGAENFWSVLARWFLTHIWPIWKIIAIIISGFSIAGIIHNVRGLNRVAAEEAKIFGSAQAATILEGIVGDERETVFETNERWEKVKSYMLSNNPSDWRLAILEADVLLEELLHTLKLPGDSVGEMLKAVDPNEFSTLDEAWEAHKMRNAIAHGGSNFILTDREAKRAIALFEKVFQEFGLI